MSQLIFSQQSSAPSTPSSGKGTIYVDNTTIPRLLLKDPSGNIVPQAPITNTSTAAVAGGYASDTYLAGSSVVVPAGIWRAKQIYRCRFDMVKTGAGTQAFTVNVRMGTLGTTGDASVLSLAFAVGTAVIDTGLFDLMITFRSVGAGTSAVIQGMIVCYHHLAATGLTTTGAAGDGIILGTSSGFNSTSQTTLGISVNGGTSFSGTNTFVHAELIG